MTEWWQNQNEYSNPIEVPIPKLFAVWHATYWDILDIMEAEGTREIPAEDAAFLPEEEAEAFMNYFEEWKVKHAGRRSSGFSIGKKAALLAGAGIAGGILGYKSGSSR